MKWSPVWIVAAVLAAGVLAIVVIYAATYASLFVRAMSAGRSKPPSSPVTAACDLLERLPHDMIRVRFIFSNQTTVDADRITVYLAGSRFDPPISALGAPNVAEMLSGASA